MMQDFVTSPAGSEIDTCTFFRGPALEHRNEAGMSAVPQAASILLHVAAAMGVAALLPKPDGSIASAIGDVAAAVQRALDPISGSTP